MTKAIIKFDFYQLFFYGHEVDDNDQVEIDNECVTSWKDGDEVEVLKFVDNPDFSGGKAFVIYNPKTSESITVASHVIEVLPDPNWQPEDNNGKH